jgi:hypothetical protein
LSNDPRDSGYRILTASVLIIVPPKTGKAHS